MAEKTYSEALLATLDKQEEEAPVDELKETRKKLKVARAEIKKLNEQKQLLMNQLDEEHKQLEQAVEYVKRMKTQAQQGQ